MIFVHPVPVILFALQTVERCFSRDVSYVITDYEASLTADSNHVTDKQKTTASGNCYSPVVSPSSAASPASRSLFGNTSVAAHRVGCGPLSPLCQSSPAYSPSTVDVHCRPVSGSSSTFFFIHLQTNLFFIQCS
jgi:hypothetical protein